jgi:hypothetical protein
MRPVIMIIIIALALCLSSATAETAKAGGAAGAVSAPWKNCTQVNKKYSHGVGKVGARDKTSGTPVTTFRRSNVLYRTAMRNNRGLDRDKDGIACEKL